MSEVNRLSLTKEQMEEHFPDTMTQEAIDFINKHIHEINKRGYCNICSEKVMKVEE